MAQPLTINLVANEILVIGTPIEVTSEEPLNPRSAQAAIMLAGERTFSCPTTDVKRPSSARTGVSTVQADTFSSSTNCCRRTASAWLREFASRS
jgi:hypothetical protein